MVKPCGATLARTLNGKTHHSFQSITPSRMSRLVILYVESLFAAESISIRLSAYSRSSGFRNHAVAGPAASQKGVTIARARVKLPSMMKRYCQPYRLPASSVTFLASTDWKLSLTIDMRATVGYKSSEGAGYGIGAVEELDGLANNIQRAKHCLQGEEQQTAIR